jgi:hypothetical protein
MDAYMFQTRTTPDGAYRFARGEPAYLPPLDASGRGTRAVQLERPLDFAAVTDHAESLGAVRLCSVGASPAYDLEACSAYRGSLDLGGGLDAALGRITERIEGLRSAEVCGADGARCREAAGDVWREIQEVAARHLDPCRFTTFVAYEYSPLPEATKIHRNVIFRGTQVPALPVSWHDEPEARGLWRRLRAECNDAGSGCRALAIPHNPNLSNGRMFLPEYGAASTPAQQAELAELRAGLEPLVEMMQMKGESECASSMWKVVGSDELCEFEKLRVPRPPDCEDGAGWGAMAGRGCMSRLDFVRYALLEGLREQERIGVNPYRFGFIGSTDIHDGTPGRVDEWSGGGNPLGRPSPGMNPGGLVAVWAEQNTREALFDAMLRREAYATSGPRITARFFGGWDYPPQLCDATDLAARGYAAGVPMGGELPPAPRAGASPVFAVSALRDPGTAAHPGGLLQRVQIVKVWLGEGDVFHQAVYDVAGDPRNGAGVDADTCQPRGPGAESLCAVWRDPEFDPGRPAVYYARVLENPSCRETAWLCAKSAAQQPAWCGDADLPRTIQERAWTSPIWYEPPEQLAAADR